MPPFLRTFAAGALTILALTAASAPSAAQSPGPVTFGVSPSSATGPDGRAAFTYDVEPGQVVEDHVGISNLSEVPLELSVYASDALTTSGGGFDLLPAGQPATGVGTWVRFAEPAVTVPPRSRLDVPFRLVVPLRATPGDHAGGIVASLRTAGADDGRLRVDRRVGARIYLRVAGELRPQLQVDGVRASYEGVADPVGGGRLTVAFDVANTGNVRLGGSARVRVAGPFGLGARTVELGEVPEVLPGQELAQRAVIEDVPPLGRLQVSVSVDPDDIGPSAAPASTARRSAWAMPWSQLALLLVAVAVAVAGLDRRRRRERRHAAELAAARAGRPSAP